MNEEMQLAWLEISDMLGEPTREELDEFLPDLDEGCRERGCIAVDDFKEKP